MNTPDALGPAARQARDEEPRLQEQRPGQRALFNAITNLGYVTFCEPTATRP